MLVLCFSILTSSSLHTHPRTPTAATQGIDTLDPLRAFPTCIIPGAGRRFRTSPPSTGPISYAPHLLPHLLHAARIQTGGRPSHTSPPRTHPTAACTTNAWMPRALCPLHLHFRRNAEVKQIASLAPWPTSTVMDKGKKQARRRKEEPSMGLTHDGVSSFRCRRLGLVAGPALEPLR